MSLKFLVVDSESVATASIKNTILEFAPDAMVYTSGSFAEAQRVLSVLFVDVLFVGIHRAEMTEGDVIKAFSNRTFEIVFIDDDYAMKTAGIEGVHRLFKPIKKSEFKNLLQRLNENINAKIAHLEQPQGPGGHILSRKLSIRDRQGIYFLPLENIVYFKADNTYSTITLKDKKQIVTSKPLGKFEDILPSEWFFRIHRTYVINLRYFQSFVSTGGYHAIMSTGEKLAISRYKVAGLRNALKKMTLSIMLWFELVSDCCNLVANSLFM